MRKHLTSILLLSIFSLVGIKALFHPGLFTAHDIWHQVARLYWYSKAVDDGQIPPYWISTLANGLGYPLFFFSYHAPWIVALPFIKLGLSIFDTIKLLFVLSYFLSGIFMYLLVYQTTKNKISGVLSAFLYLWAPYHFLTIFVFAAMGTSFIFLFLPILLLGLQLVSDKNARLGILITGIGTAGLILSHLITFLSLIPLASAYILYLLSTQKNKRAFLRNILCGTVLALGISSFYLIPAVAYSHLTQASTGAFSKIYENNFLSLKDILYSKWGYATTGFSVQLGIAHWVVVIGTLAILLVRRRKYGQLILLSVLVLDIFMMTHSSKPVWDFATHIVSLDFPSMFLLSAVFIASFLAGLLILGFSKKLQILLTLLLILLALYTNRNHLNVNQYTNYSLEDYVGAETTTNSYHEYFPKVADLKLLEEDQDYVVLPKNLKVTNVYRNTKELSFGLATDRESEVSIKQLAFPGTNLYIDGSKAKYQTDGYGRIKTTISEGKHIISVRFEETLLIMLAKTVSLISISATLLLFRKKHV